MQLYADEVAATNALTSTYTADAYTRAQQAQAITEKQAGTLTSLSTLEEKITPYIKNIALAGVALIVTIAILKSGKKARK